MTGRHAAPPDELFDQRERERAGAHRADVPVPLGPDDTPAKPAAKKKAPAKKAAAKKAAPAKAAPSASEKPAPSKRASKR